MFWVDIISWWYGYGFKALSKRISEIFAQTTDFFSISDLLGSLFKPYRQTLTTSNYKRTVVQKMGDAFVSRLIGFVTRIFIILFGLVFYLFELIVSLAAFILWPLIPILPLILITLTVINFGF